MVMSANQKSVICIQKRKWNPNITPKPSNHKRTKECREKKDLQNQIQHNKQNGSENIHINNYHKCKQIKYSNQKTQIG